MRAWGPEQAVLRELLALFHVKLNSTSMVEPPDRPVSAKLGEYTRLLVAKAVPQGLISMRDESRLWSRHVLDSLRGLGCLEADVNTVLDLGSGAGLPGIPVAIARPDLTVVLVESRSRRVGFLEMAVETLGLTNATVLGMRVEEVQERVDACLSRALSDAPTSWGMAEPLLREGGMLLYWAGRSWMEEAHRSDLPWQICSPSEFPWQGPVVMMRRPHR